MYCYIPDKLYNLCKDDPVYIDIINRVKSHMNDITSIKDMVEMDSYVIKNYPELYDEYIEIMKDMALKYNEDSYISTLLINHKKGFPSDVVEMIYKEYVNSNYIKTNPELGMYIIMIMQHSVVESMPETMKLHKVLCNIFNSCTDEQKRSLSTYCIAKYYLSSMIIYINEKGKNRDPKYISKVITKNKEMRDYILTITDDIDLVNYKYLQALDFMMHQLITFYGDIDAYKMIKDVNMINEMRYVTHSYKTHLYQYINMFDYLCSIYFYGRDIEKYFYYMKHLYKVVNYAMKDFQTLVKALEFSRDINQYGFLFILRKLVKLEPLFKNFDIQLDYISDEDREFVLLDEYNMNDVNAADGMYMLKSDIPFIDTASTGMIEMIEGIINTAGVDRINDFYNGKRDTILPTFEEVLEEILNASR